MKKFNQIEIADATGIDKSMISKYLRGVVVPSLAVANFVAKRTSLPTSIFTSPDAQEVYLDEVYLSEAVLYIPKKRRK